MRTTTRLLRATSSVQEEVVSKEIPPVQVVNSMPDPLPNTLHNKYYFLRHGQSTANVDSIISSNRFELAYTDKHGLTELGYQQGRKSAPEVLDLLISANGDHNKVIFVSSPFARARQTAQACLDGMAKLQHSVQVETEIQLQDGLMERYFGRLDGEAIYTYAYVWPLDKFNVTHTAFDVESVASVCHRFRQLIVDLEAQYPPALATNHIVLVGHADVLQIAQLYAAGAANVGDFSSYRFQNGEVRMMVLNDVSYLPEPKPLEKPDRTTKTAIESTSTLSS